MSEPFLAEIKMFAGNFAPRGYAFCNGQIMPLSQNTALFALLGVNYGGNGQSTFGLPNLQNSAPMFWGNGPGLTPRDIGEIGGESAVTLLITELPMHTHGIPASSSAPGDTESPANAAFGNQARGRTQVYTGTGTPPVQMALQSVSPVGGNQPHNNMQPYLGINFIIATQGIFPARN